MREQPCLARGAALSEVGVAGLQRGVRAPTSSPTAGPGGQTHVLANGDPPLLRLPQGSRSSLGSRKKRPPLSLRAREGDAAHTGRKGRGGSGEGGASPAGLFLALKQTDPRRPPSSALTHARTRRMYSFNLWNWKISLIRATLVSHSSRPPAPPDARGPEGAAAPRKHFHKRDAASMCACGSACGVNTTVRSVLRPRERIARRHSPNVRQARPAPSEGPAVGAAAVPWGGWRWYPGSPGRACSLVEPHSQCVHVRAHACVGVCAVCV